ncbi:LacI family DNA-binding transcriptional regulator [Streptococcus parauberis]|uniref:LacI family DNA-binding transcriptional regulator n=1 Tax=Streptococcus parauberis TaxID=1348 RepID=UPI000789BDCF|nr:LacI family DNA-binding transcriptional regulator [Streptococcus parauberis]KYP17989.1 HTH-type transcriptional regulator KdgR [Streptococcus parauberis]KYP19140.1 HTH-type transcriptional regulator KdgR [Streptococcus parauberis]KYP19647.1 HTH-type transcriptional regulator KdgR [Streptococcus parauberis]KYP23380.1 HTH-type transcriptional regulator KdgR [Streptococcus parauberis]KYP26605.1 HTH-type transcriptional regulator KdgR [Streptococcus parauberis]
MNKKVTISDIANLSGVSKTTISRYLNGKYEGMSEATRNRIQEVIEEVDYRPSRQARALKSQYSSIIGIVVADISNSYTSRMIKGVMDRLNSTDYHTIIMDSDLNTKREANNIKKLIDEQVDGIVIQPIGESSLEYDFIPSGMSLVQIDRYVEPLKWPAVVSDNFLQSQNLGRIIAENDYKRVIILTPEIKNVSPRINRYKGLQNGLADYDVEVIIVTTNEIKDIVARDIDIWDQMKQYIYDDVKTVLYAFNGGLLYGLIRLLKEKNIPVPDKIGLVGYDDGALTDLFNPEITSIEQNPVEIGHKAADILLNTMAGKDILIDLYCIDSKLNNQKSL